MAFKIGDEVYIRGNIDEIRKDTIIIRNDGGYFGTIENEIQACPGASISVHWVSCKDRPPETSGLYLITADGDICGSDNFVCVDEYFADGDAKYNRVGWDYDLMHDNKGPSYVLSWAEMPEPSEYKYKEV